MSTHTERLRTTSTFWFSLYAMGAAFGTYFFMYGLRRPFAVGTWGGEGVGGLDLKTLYILSQVAGYALSKWIGVKLVSEVAGKRRGLTLVAASLLAFLSLVGFAVVPAPWAALLLFCNGLPLGLIWGLVFGYLEGRRVSDWLGAGLCASFILASGVVKALGRSLLDWGVPEPWMPATAGLICLLPMLGFSAMLANLPPPDAADVASRSLRAPMDASARKRFLRENATVLAPLLLAYVGLTAFRDFRDNFSRELWDALGYAESPEVFALAELPVAAGALLPVVLVGLFRDNRRATYFLYAVIAGGGLLAAAATLLFAQGAIGPATWMIGVGLGAYLAYVPYNCALFDRLVALFGSAATATFLIQLADSLGYLASSGLLLGKTLGAPEIAWVPFFSQISYGLGLLCLLTVGASAWALRQQVPPTSR